jgi:CDGSH-type Zn-finger protein
MLRMRPVVSADGSNVGWERRGSFPDGGDVELCRCGASSTKPFCDGSESRVGFDGTEAADRGPGDERRAAYGEPPMVLTDDVTLCALAKFCHVGDVDVWTLATSGTPEDRERLRAMVGRCPSGRLALEASAALADSAEPVFEPEVAVLDDGPLWVRGGVPIQGADGFVYEGRNRATLCRCGQSRNKPFCDGSHRRVGFRDS